LAADAIPAPSTTAIRAPANGAGASYGDYSVLMGLVNDPGLYKCGINWAGVTDINLMYEGTWLDNSDLSDDYKKYGMPTLIGDQVKDAAQLKATSPLEQAARITQPLLLAEEGHGWFLPKNRIDFWSRKAVAQPNRCQPYLGTCLVHLLILSRLNSIRL
jgi:hypothetical protein